MGRVVVELVGEPRGKGRPRFSRKSGHVYTPARTASFEANLKYAAQEAMAGRPPMEGALICDVVVYLPVPQSWSRKRQATALAGLELPAKRPDWDNYIKAASDAFNEVVWRDDCQVTDGSFKKRYDARPRLVVTVAPVEELRKHDHINASISSEASPPARIGGDDLFG